MMELPLLPLPDLMASKARPSANAVSKNAQARKSLAAAELVHSKLKRTSAPLIDLDQFFGGDLAEPIVAADDSPGRKTYFVYSGENPYIRGGLKVHMEVGRHSTMYDYVNGRGARIARTAVCIPPKLREQSLEVAREEQPIITTAIITLDSWPCQEIKMTNGHVVVTTAADDLDSVRKKVQKALVSQARRAR